MDKKPPLISINNFAILFYILAVLSLTRQFPVTKLSSLILVFLILSIGVALPKIWKNFNESKKEIKVFTMIYFIVFTFLFLYSVLLQHNEIGNAVRTYGVCLLLVVSYFFLKDKRIAKAFIIVMLLHALILIGLQVYMMLHSSPNFNAHIRNTFSHRKFGDIFSRNGWLFRIIIKGNELLPVAFMMAHNIYKKGFKRFYKYIILLATVIAGNLAYFITLAMYVFIKMLIDKKGRKILLVLTYIGMAVFLVLNKPILNILTKTMEIKNEKSMPVRYEQIDTLLGDFEKPYEVFLGRGMGNTITAENAIRSYKNAKYFELQVMYFLNQLGVLAFFMLIIYNIYVPIKYFKLESLIIYGAYLLYAITNPYILNLSHIVVLIALVSFNEITNYNNESINV